MNRAFSSAIGLSLAITALVWTAPARAQTTVSLGGGYTSGLDPSTFSKYWPHGYHFGGGIEGAFLCSRTAEGERTSYIPITVGVAF